MAVEDPTKKQIEEVDPEVAKILGLEDNFDLEYDEYMTLMKEAIAKGAFDEKLKLSEEDLAKIANERKRIRDLKESTFTTGKKGINVDSFFNKKPQEEGTTKKPITDAAKLLPGSGGALAKYQPPEEPEEKKEPEVDKNSEKIESIENFLNGPLLDIVKEIRSLTEDILKVFNNQAKVNKKGQEKSRIEGNKQKKASKEDKLEAQKESKGSKLLEKITRPFTSIFDTIKDFILNILLGSFVVWLLGVLKDPKKLLQPIQNLINGIVGFFNTVLNFIDNLVVKPIRTFISTMNSAISGFIQLLNNALKFIPGSPQIPDPKGGVLPNIPAMPQITPPNITGQNNQQSNQQQPSPKVNVRFGGGPITKNKQVFVKNVGGSMSGGTKKSPEIGNDTASNFGGVVNRDTVNTKISGLGPDQYLTALSLGEYILKPGAVDFLGGEKYLDTVNRLFGGTNQTKIASMGDVKIEAMNTGGSVGRRDGEGGRGQGGTRSSGSSPGGIKPGHTQTGSSASSQGSRSSGSSPGAIKPSLDLDLPSAPIPTIKTSDGRSLDPKIYVKNTQNTTYIKVGEKNPKSYILRYERKGDVKEPVYVVKQISKLVQGSFLGLDDKLTGVNVKSPEGQSVLASTNVKQWLSDYDHMGLIDPKKIKLIPHENSDIWFWYSRAYKSNYDALIKKKVPEEEAKQKAAAEAATFSMPDGVKAAPDNIKKSDSQETSLDSPNPTNTDTQTNTSNGSNEDVSWIDPNFNISGSKVKDFYLQALKDGTYVKKQESSVAGGVGGGSPSNFLKLSGTSGAPGAPGAAGAPGTNGNPSSFLKIPSTMGTGGGDSGRLDPTKTGASVPHVWEAAQTARAEARSQGLSPAEVERKVVAASERALRQGPPTIINQNLIQPVSKPTIPGTPETKSSLTVLPMAGSGSGGQGAPKVGSTNTPSTPQVSFASFDSSHTSIVSVASIYNIWGM
jgi:hypothetical protein